MIVALAALAASLAQAEEDARVPAPSPETEEELDREAYEAALEAALELPPLPLDDDRPRTNVVSFGIGALGFIGERWPAGSLVGPAATLRYTLALGGPVGAEVAWTTSPTLDLDGPRGLVLLFEATAKLSGAPHWPVSPLAALGLGYGMFAGPERSDTATTTVPVAIGVEGVTEHTLLGARAIWRPTFFDEDAIPFTDLGADTWGLQAEVGARF